MDVDDLANATAALNLGAHCCDSCCRPTFFFLANDPPEEVLSRSAKRKFYVVNKGAVGSEGIYTHWDVARTKVEGISDAVHESSKTANGACAIWADYCHRFHEHSAPQPSTVAPLRLPIAPARTNATPRRRVVDAPRAFGYAANALKSAVRPSPTVYAVQAHAITVHAAHTLATTRLKRHGASPHKFYRVCGSPRVLIVREDAEAELRAGLGTTLLVGGSLEAVEGDDEVTLVGGGPMFYRVFGSPRVATNRDSALAELVATGAGGLLVGSSLAAVDDS
ncbi:hypothetical protein B0H14DRAFT_3512638 [Mycena olivaceomarginata]|nr:hypothetical protein B0H14DRAFT_3512638 [Mycena olivaceomarginata]